MQYYSTRLLPTPMEGSTNYNDLKPGKPAELIESYRLISSLPVLSKLFEKLLLSRINIIMENHRLIPEFDPHQFDFRCKHATTEQIHRIVKRINNDMEADRHCSAVFRLIGFQQGTEDCFTKSKQDFQLTSTLS